MPEAGYLNFDLEIERVGQGYRAQVLSSPAGEGNAEMPSLAALDLAGTPQVVGTQLFDATFRGEVLTCLRRSLDAAQLHDKGLRVRLRLIDVPELANLPWESLYDQERGRFLALSAETPLVRYLDLPEPPRELQPEPRLRILAVIASPAGFPPLDTNREWRNLQEALGELQARGIVALDRLEPPSLDALQQQLRRQEYHILHFLGHGTFDAGSNDSVLLLQAADGTSEAVSGQSFSLLLNDHRTLRLALLNACQGAEASETDPYSGVAQRLVRGGVPAVIAMRTAISDQAGIGLARSFYAALADGDSVDAALGEARKALFTGGNETEWATPVLYMRASAGNLWRSDEAAPRARRRKAVLIGGVAFLLLALAFGIYSLIGPSRMDAANTLNIAVAEVAILDQAGQARAAADGMLLRTWIVDALAQANADLEAGHRAAIWHDGLPRTQKRPKLGFVVGATPDQRAAAAEMLAQRIGADVVIYGHLAPDSDPVTFVQEFYVLPRLQPEANETIGHYQLGESIALPTSLAAADSLARETVAAQVSQRAALLFGALLGLREDVLGRHAEALTLLRETESQLPAVGEPGGGGDVLYYFIAREALFLGRYDEAVAAASTALRINPHHARAYVVLGGTYLRQGLAQPPALALADAGLFQQAEAAYQQAVNLTVTSGDTRIELVARLALANAYLTQGTVYYNLDEPEAADPAAAQRFDQAAINLRPLLAPLAELKQYRLLGQAYAYLGVTRLLQGNLALRAGDTDRGRALLTEARDAFTGCQAQGQQFPEDRTLAEKIVRDVCTPSRQQAEDALQGLGGG